MPRGIDRLVLFVALTVPAVVSIVVWSHFADAIFGGPQPEVQGVAATPVRQTPGAVPSPLATTSPAAIASPSASVVALGSPSVEPSPSSSSAPARADAPAPAPAPEAPPAVAPAAPPGVQQPTPTSIAPPLEQPSLAGASAVGAVRTFYQHVAKHEASSAEALWSPHMREAFPPQENLVRRFADTTAIDVRDARLVSLDESAGTAVVEVDLVETVGSPGGQRHYQGTWRLVRSGGQWLLDQPNLKQI